MTWYLLYRHQGRYTRFKVGRYPGTKLAQARKEASKRFREAETGVDIAAERKIQRQADTVAELIDSYLDRYAKKKHKDRGAYCRKILDKHVVPIWGKRKPHDLKRRDLSLLVEKINGDIMANRVISLTRALFNWAVDSGEIEATPFSRFKHVAKEQPRDRILTRAEICSVWNTCSSLQDLWRLLLLTGQRVGEVIKINQADIEGALWTLTADATKGNRKHLVPLSDAAIEIIERRLEKSVWLFPKRGEDDLPMVAYSRGWSRMILREQLSGITPHDVRRTVVTYLPKVEGIDQRRLKRLVLGHADSEVTSVYDQATYLDEKREALDRWQHILLAITSGRKTEVLPFEAA